MSGWDLLKGKRIARSDKNSQLKKRLNARFCKSGSAILVIG